jgi:flagellum-specific peptidoglycan hydrolase FlgJ
MISTDLKYFGILLCATIACNSSGFSGENSKNNKETLPEESTDSREEDGDANAESEKKPTETNFEEPKQEQNSKTTEIPKKPRKGCQAFFSGALLGDRVVNGYLSVIYGNDLQTNQGSEWVGEGDYPSALQAFPKANATTFDGIAFDKGTRVVIYSAPDFNGTVLFDQEGPYVISNFPPNMDYKHSEVYKIYRGRWREPLHSKFPVSVRNTAPSNMHTWGLGSLKVTCRP